MKKIIKIAINLYRLIIPIVLYRTCKYRSLIEADLRRNGDKGLLITLIDNKAFRNVFYYRTSKQKILSTLSRIFLKPLETVELYISPEKIGGGLRVLHNMGAVITPYSAGSNLTVGQGVTIGTNTKRDYPSGRHNPVIGDNVHISTNAVVIGGITIGDNVLVGAGAVVTKDVPSNCVVAGVPARIIERLE